MPNACPGRIYRPWQSFDGFGNVMHRHYQLLQGTVMVVCCLWLSIRRRSAYHAEPGYARNLYSVPMLLTPEPFHIGI